MHNINFKIMKEPKVNEVVLKIKYIADLKKSP